MFIKTQFASWFCARFSRYSAGYMQTHTHRCVYMRSLQPRVTSTSSEGVEFIRCQWARTASLQGIKKKPGSASSAGAPSDHPQILAHNIAADFTGTTQRWENNRVRHDVSPGNYIYIPLICFPSLCFVKSSDCCLNASCQFVEDTFWTLHVIKFRQQNHFSYSC